MGILRGWATLGAVDPPALARKPPPVHLVMDPGIADKTPRTTCAACRRPESVCYCRHVTVLDTKTRVVLLQHPRERHVAIGTARMASLCLPNSEIHVGVEWRSSAAVARALCDPERTAALLYPGEGAIDVLRNPPRTPVTLVVVDGTWAQAKKVLRQNPDLAALPRYAFTPPSPSEYRIRKEPSAECVSTIEALAHVLGALEGDAGRFQGLLAPFRAMVDSQIACEARYQGARIRHARKRRSAPSPSPVPTSLRDRARDVVCVAGEANAWPYGSRERREGHSDELVHWVARRTSTDETFAMIVAPRNPLSAGTVAHCGLSSAALAAGASAAAFRAAWRAFVGDSDILCSWGPYVPALLAAIGGHVPSDKVDLRAAARLFVRGSAGSPSDFASRVGEHVGGRPRPERAFTRLESVVAVARYFQRQP